MTLQFREKALIAYETMPLEQREKVSTILEQLAHNDLTQLDYQKVKDLNLDAWVVTVDEAVQLFFKSTAQGFLIIDMIEPRRKVHS